MVAAVHENGCLAVSFEDGDYQSHVHPRDARLRVDEPCRTPTVDQRHPNRHCRVRVRFNDFGAEFDEWLPADSKRIRPPMTAGARLCNAFGCTCSR